MKPYPRPFHHVYLGWASSSLKEVLVIGSNIIIIYLLFGLFLPYEMGGDIRVILGGGGVLPSNPHIIPVIS